MFYFLSKLLLILLNPIFWISCVLGYLLKVKKPKSPKVLLSLSLLALLILSNDFITNKLMSWWEQEVISVQDLNETYDFAIILTGDLGRVYPAIEMYKQGIVRKICIVGRPEEKDYKSELIKYGVPAEKIFAEEKSKNTYQSALYFNDFFSSIRLHEMSQNANFILITDAFHLRRSVMCFEKQGWVPTSFGTQFKSEANKPFRLLDLLPSGLNIFYWEVLIKEWVGIITYKLMGYA